VLPGAGPGWAQTSDQRLGRMAAWGNLGRYLFGMDSWTARGSARPTASRGLRANSAPVGRCSGFGTRDNPGPAGLVGGACEAGETSPARADAPIALGVSRVRLMVVSSPTKRVSRTPSRIQDCPTASRVALQVYIMGDISRLGSYDHNP